jgi:hypothetical protein
MPATRARIAGIAITPAISAIIAAAAYAHLPRSTKRSRANGSAPTTNAIHPVTSRVRASAIRKSTNAIRAAARIDKIAIDSPICVWGTAGIAVRGAGVLRAAAVFRAPATGSSSAAKGDDGARGAGQDQKVEAEALAGNVIKIVREFFARALDTAP